MRSYADLVLPPAEMRTEGGSCIVTNLPPEFARGDTVGAPERSPLVLMEDGRRLGPAHSAHTEIRALGEGRYSHWDGALYFSTSDNTDPRSNGRSYLVRAQRAFVDEEVRGQLDAAFVDLEGEFHNYPGLTTGDQQAAFQLARDVIARVIDLVPQQERAEETFRICERLSLMRGASFEAASPMFRNPVAYNSATEAIEAVFKDGRAVHLELGAFNVWPADRVEGFIEEQARGDLIRLDMNPEFPIDVSASVTALPFADESIDVISSNSLFEHVAYPHEIIREAFRVLRPGGAIFTMVPFHFVAHGCPNDYLRYTGEFFDEVCRAAGFETVHSDTWASSGPYHVTHQFLKGVTALEPHGTYVGRSAQVVHLAMMATMAALQTFDDHMLGGGPNHYQTTRAVAVKRGPYVSRAAAPDRSMPFVERYLDRLVCPATGLPLVRDGDGLRSLCGRRTYEVVDGVPRLFVLHGFGSSFTIRASSRQQHSQWISGATK